MAGRYQELSPSTPRLAGHLARIYGFTSVRALAEDLPYGARVADIGAGASTFGHTIASLRGDITWWNVDLKYPQALPRRPAPFNLHYLTGSATGVLLEPHTFDRVFSSAMLTHIILDSREGAETAVHNMAGLLCPTGKLAISGFSILPVYSAQVLTAGQYERDPQGSVEAVVDRLTPDERVQNGLMFVMDALEKAKGFREQMSGLLQNIHRPGSN